MSAKRLTEKSEERRVRVNINWTHDARNTFNKYVCSNKTNLCSVFILYSDQSQVNILFSTLSFKLAVVSWMARLIRTRICI